MKRSTKQWMAVVLSAQTLTAGSAANGLAGQAPNGKVEVVNRAANQPVAVKPGALKGTILNPADQKPWGRTSVELVDPATGKVLKKTRADKQGRYDLGQIEEGKYIIRINGKIEVPLEVSKAASASVLNIAVPTALMGGALGGTMSWTTIGLVGAGVATAVAVPVAIAGGGGGGGGGAPVSGS